MSGTRTTDELQCLTARIVLLLLGARLWRFAYPPAAAAAGTATHAALPCTPWLRLEHEDGIVARFVIGHSSDPRKEAALAAEASQHGDMLRLDLVEGYAGLPAKTIAFLRVRWQGGYGTPYVAVCAELPSAAEARLAQPACTL